MRVLHFITSIDRASGGTSSYMQLLAKELGKLVELHVVTHKSENPLELENCSIHYIKGNALGMGMKSDWLMVLNSIKPDVVHVNCCWMPEIALAQRWAQELGYKVVLTPHGMLEPWIMQRHYWTKKVPAIWLFQRKAVKRADCIHATAESERQNLLKLGWNDRIEVIANGIDVESIGMKLSWKRTGKILFLSRVHPKKGINFIIEAVALLKTTNYTNYTNSKNTEEVRMAAEIKDYAEKLKENPCNSCNSWLSKRNDSWLEKLKFVVAGESYGNYVEELKQLAREKGVDDMFEFVGGVYGNEKWELFRQADLFVLPTYSENFGIVVAEALASGTPVITTKGTPWQELETCECGWWTEVGTEPTVKALVSFLSLTEQDFERMGRNGRRLVEEKYSAKSVAEQMVKLYMSLNHELH